MNKTVNYKAGDLVLESGQFGKGFCILKAGSLEVKKGSTVIAEITSIGAIFGEMSEILGKPRYVDVFAKTDASVLQVDKSIEDLASTNPEITIKLIKTLARRLEDTTAKVAYDLSEEKIEEDHNKIKILIIEDQEAVADEIGQKMNHTGWDFTFARSPERAMEYCERDPFHLIIISLGLPNEGAFSLRRALRSIRKSAETPMLALVVKSDTGLMDKARQYGFNRQVEKPIDYLDLESNMYQAMLLDPTESCYAIRDNTSICTLPQECSEFIFTSFMEYMDSHVKDVVNKGLRRLIVDATQVMQADLRNSDIIYNFKKTSEKLTIDCLLVCTTDELPNWKKFEKTKNLEFITDLQEAIDKELPDPKAENEAEDSATDESSSDEDAAEDSSSSPSENEIEESSIEKTPTQADEKE